MLKTRAHPFATSLRWLRSALLCSVLLAAAVACGSAEDASRNRPNVLLYIIDTLRADGLADEGQGAHTPHIDELAQNGVRFNQAFANSSWTRASVASILTGLAPWRHGAEGRDDALAAEVVTLAVHLERAGYDCALVSANPNVSRVFGFGRSFGSVRELFARRSTGDVRGRELITPSNVVTEEALDWIDTAGRPFCLVVLSIDPHAPYAPPGAFAPDVPRQLGGFKALNSKAATAADREAARALYRGEVAFNDSSLGELLEALRGRELFEDTLTIVTSDHGEEFWEHGRRGHGKSLSDEVLRVPLVFHHPASERLTPGRASDRLAQLVDVVPSILDLLELPAPDDLDGRSLFSPSIEADRPALAALRLDGADLLTARLHPWKVVWNRRDGVRQIRNLDAPALGGEPGVNATESADAANGPVSRLVKVLQAIDANRSPDRGAPVLELPRDVEESLEALGYLEESSP
jgi:arylsulfatase A-like enzyme